MKEVTIYTDGACSGNPGYGGFGAILMYNDLKKEISGGFADTTNNRMELTAVIEALKCLKQSCSVKLYSDSAYVINAFNDGWIDKWRSFGWKKSANTELLNADLWRELYCLTQSHIIAFIKVKGHSDNEHNNRCDLLARKALAQKRIDDTQS